jgi:hypothetical protein
LHEDHTEVGEAFGPRGISHERDNGMPALAKLPCEAATDEACGSGQEVSHC